MNGVLRLFVSAAALLAILVPARAQEAASRSMSLKTVVIDPGHGGKDAGCISRDKKTYEKNIVLDVSKRLAQKISAAYPDVTVLMTRGDDTFVELENRAVFANKAGADLFISIHVNAVDKGTAANGYSIHCLGQSRVKGNDLYSKNLDLVKRENSVIMLEEGYETKYQGFDPNDPQSSIIFNLMQNAHLGNSLAFAEDVAAAMGSSPIRNSRGVSQDPFWVLWRTAMPSVLVEVGFITNDGDLKVMTTPEGRDRIAENLARAVKTFKTRYDNTAELPEEKADTAAAAPAEKPSSASPASTSSTGIVYGVQVLATGKKMSPSDPFFRGYTPLEVKAGKLYKYILVPGEDLSAVRKKHRELSAKFPGCFIVSKEGETVTFVR